MGTKFCTKCLLDKPLAEFAKKGSKHHCYCKCCHNSYMKEHYKKNKAAYLKKASIRNGVVRKETTKFVWEYLKTHGCVDCPETDPIVLEFDHVRGTKRREVGRLTQFSLKAVQEEIAKCEVRCANCHRRKTAKQLGWHKEFTSDES